MWIENPAGIRMAQWLNIETEMGLASLSMALSEEPTLGQWKISAMVAGSKQSQMFKVQEYGRSISVLWYWMDCFYADRS